MQRVDLRLEFLEQRRGGRALHRSIDPHQDVAQRLFLLIDHGIVRHALRTAFCLRGIGSAILPGLGVVDGGHLLVRIGIQRLAHGLGGLHVGDGRVTLLFRGVGLVRQFVGFLAEIDQHLPKRRRGRRQHQRRVATLDGEPELVAAIR